jgi:iron complex outermembrane recepter protein
MLKSNLSVAISAALLTTTAGLRTQDALGQTLDEIVVTAQKREENVQDVPISITVISAEELARQGIQIVQDLSKVSASLEFTDQAVGPGGGGFVRGIGFLGLGAPTAQSSVSVVLDGVVLGNVPVTDLYDLERVEILKGPQGTLFGASVSSGVVSLTSRAPDPTEKSLSVSAEIAGSTYDRTVLRVAGNIPTGDNSALRIAAHTYQNDGFSHNVNTGADSKYDSSGIRLRYLHDFSDNLTMNLIADYNKTDETDFPLLIYTYAPPGSALAGALDECGITPTRNNVDNCSGQVKDRNNETKGLSAQFDWGIGDLTATSITSYRKLESESVSDILNIPQAVMANWFTSANGCNPGGIPCNTVQRLTPGYPGAPATGDRDLLTQEFRIASPVGEKVEWVAGLFYQDYELSSVGPGWLTIGVPTPIPCIFIGAGIVEGPGACRINDTVTRESSQADDSAVFANFTVNLSDMTRFIVGGRYTSSNVGFTELDPTGMSVADSLDVDANEFTWRLAVQHDLNDNTMFYASASTGYKAPQINTQTPGNYFEVEAETPESYEVGIKTTVANGRMGVNADIFYMDVTNYQGQNCVADPQGGIDCQSVNVPNVQSKGLELDIFGRPTERTSMNLSAIYNIAEYPDNYFDEFGGNLGGQQLAYAPKYKVTLTVEHEFPLNDTLSLTLGGDVTARDKQLMYLAASQPEFVAPATTLYNARIGIRSVNDWAVYLFGRNLGDEIYPNNYFPTIAFHQGGVWQTFDFAARRLAGVQFEANF